MISIPFLDGVLKGLHPKVYDDLGDRLNYFYTPVFLMFFSIVVSAKQYVGSPIQCWIPAEFKGGWEQYTEDYCFIKNTYYIPLNKNIPNDHEHRKNKEIGYYQWVPIMLAVQALLFYLPFFVWKGFCSMSGVNLKSILKQANNCSNLDSEKRKKELETLARFMEDNLELQRDVGVRTCRAFPCVRCGKQLGSFVNSLYLFVKFLFLLNVVGQFFLMNSFLGTSYNFWGIQILWDLIQGREWEESGHFPRITLCDFTVRRMGNLHPYSVQCVLMINMFNEKIFLFLWFWMLLVAAYTLINFLFWLLSSLSTTHRENIVRRYLRLSRSFGDGELGINERLIRRFTHQGLRPDGVLILRFVSCHSGDLVSMDLTNLLWQIYAKRMVGPGNGQATKRMDDVDSGANSTQSTSPEQEGFHEDLYDPNKKQLNGGMMPLLPTAPMTIDGAYPGPPLMPKPKVADV